MLKKYIQIISTPEMIEKWVLLAKSRDMPLVTYIKYLLTRELDK